MKSIQWEELLESELMEMNGGLTKNSYRIAQWLNALCIDLLKL